MSLLRAGPEPAEGVGLHPSRGGIEIRGPQMT
jgi:hypothetical protein